MTKSPAPLGNWNTWEVAGLACDVYEPPQANEHGYTLIYLHDADSAKLEGRTRFESAFAAHGLRVIAPQCGRCWWSDHPTTEFVSIVPKGNPQETAEQFVSQTLLAAIQSTYAVAPPQLALFGIGMGGQGALRISYKHPNTFPVVAGIASDLDFQHRIKEGDEVLYGIYGDTESARQDTAILHIHPLNWPRHQFFCADPDDPRTFDAADRLRMKLSSIGIMHECDLASKRPAKSFFQRQEVEYVDHIAGKAIEFLVERLNKERLRIV